MGIIIITILLVSQAVSLLLKGKLARHAQTRLSADLTGAEVATQMLRKHGIEDVQVTHTDGYLTDHYNPRNKTVNLSFPVYYQKNAAAAAVAAHECGHAVQHAQGYAFFRLRSAMVPMLLLTSRCMPWVVLLGIAVVELTPLPLKIGIGLFSLTTLFAFITLPVEFDASSRALAWMSREGVVTGQEYSMAKDALRWAAMTYVLAALGSLVELLRLIARLQKRENA